MVSSDDRELVERVLVRIGVRTDAEIREVVVALAREIERLLAIPDCLGLPECPALDSRDET